MSTGMAGITVSCATLAAGLQHSMCQAAGLAPARVLFQTASQTLALSSEDSSMAPTCFLASSAVLAGILRPSMLEEWVPPPTKAPMPWLSIGKAASLETKSTQTGGGTA